MFKKKRYALFFLTDIKLPSLNKWKEKNLAHIPRSKYSLLGPGSMKVCHGTSGLGFYVVRMRFRIRPT
jgi:hypothetical protein